ncbi:MAG: DUF1697 domain-containing protein [Acidobacteriota bacterium]|nr:DUF1697 domain-containing protein [Acidobacteriota bacterium]
MIVISLLRGVNVGGHNRIKMDSLRTLYESLGLRDARTHVQSGNVIFATEDRDVVRVSERIADGIERSFGFRPRVIARTVSEMRGVVARNPFAGREGIEPSKLLVVFLASEPSEAVREKVREIATDSEELRIGGRELYIYFRNGMARPKLSPALFERTLKIPGTGRNWNSVTKLLEIAEEMETV